MSKVRKIVSYILMVAFISYCASIILFPHKHTISGSTIVHSHLHTDSHHDTNSGGHTEQCITLIAHLSHFDYINFSSNGVPIPYLLPLYEKEGVETTHWVVSVYFENLSLRAPPVV